MFWPRRTSAQICRVTLRRGTYNAARLIIRDWQFASGVSQTYPPVFIGEKGLSGGRFTPRLNEKAVK
jgi:hypothetical protein